MPSKLRLKAFVIVLAILGVASFFLLRQERPQATPRAPEPNTAPPAPAGPAPEPPRANKALDPGLQAEVNAFRQARPVERVARFYEAESRRVGEIDKDPELTARRLAAMAAELKPEEITWLKDAALERKRPGDGRFFAAYLLAQAPTPATVEALRSIAISPLPALKNQGLVELERQVRAQAAEGLGHARGISAAQDSLLDIVEQAQDEFVRDRAHRALYEWRTGKPVEEQDREALRKVMDQGPR